MCQWLCWFCSVSVGFCFLSDSACPPGCLECDSGSLCHLCDRTTFLKNKICVSACGQGFYGNPQTRECEEGECLSRDSTIYHQCQASDKMSLGKSLPESSLVVTYPFFILNEDLLVCLQLAFSSVIGKSRWEVICPSCGGDWDGLQFTWVRNEQGTQKIVLAGTMPARPVVVPAVTLLPSFPSASRHPWSSRASSTLRVGIGGVQPLELALLGCDGASGQPLFQVDSIPSTGRLVLLQGGQEVPLSRGQRFSCRDLRDRRVRFVHSRDEPR